MSYPYFREDTLLGNLSVVAQRHKIPYEISNSTEGYEYLSDLAQLYEFGTGLLPEVTYSYRQQCESARYGFEYAGHLVSLIMEISNRKHAICLFNHLNSFTGSHVFILPQASDLLKLFQKAQPCDYFMSDMSGNFMLAANWHSFTYAT